MIVEFCPDRSMREVGRPGEILDVLRRSGRESWTIEEGRLEPGASSGGHGPGLGGLLDDGEGPVGAGGGQGNPGTVVPHARDVTGGA